VASLRLARKLFDLLQSATATDADKVRAAKVLERWACNVYSEEVLPSLAGARPLSQQRLRVLERIEQQEPEPFVQQLRARNLEQREVPGSGNQYQPVETEVNPGRRL